MLSGKEMLVDAEDLRTFQRRAFTCHLSKPVAEPALDSGTGDMLPLRQPAAADPIEVFLANRPPERLGGAHARQNAGKTLPESALAGQTTPLPGFQFYDRMAHTPAFVPRPTNPQVFHSQIRSLTVRTKTPPCEARRNANLTPCFFYGCNLIIG